MRKLCQEVFAAICDVGKASVRKIAELTGISKSSTHRHMKRIEQRNLYPESHLWEREEGHQWLCILVFAVVYVFGIMRGIGAETISSFFKLIRLDKHIGVSPTAIRNIRRKMEEKILEYKKIHEINHQSDQAIEIVGGADETFFENMILVLMDLSSGYIFLEEEAQNRDYETWKEKAQRVLNGIGIKVKYMVSDRAKALIKLATNGLHCLSIPDLFHASNEIVKLMGSRLRTKLTNVNKKLSKAVATLALLKELNKGIEQINQQQRIIDELTIEREIIESAMDSYSNILYSLSNIVHPFDILNFCKQTSAQVEVSLWKLVEAIRKILEEHNIKDTQNRLNTLSNQIPDIASLIDAWWLWVEESLNDYEIDERVKLWLIDYLLPVTYWENLAQKTKNPGLKKGYQTALEQTRCILNHHPLTDSITEKQMQQWQFWAEWMVSKFQRASSAVEGRNGYLSQIYHNIRGIGSQRLKVLTVIHNFGLQRPDGTTAAQRLFRVDFPNLFGWIVDQMDDLPLPRRAGASRPNKSLSASHPCACSGTVHELFSNRVHDKSSGLPCDEFQPLSAASGWN